MMKRCCLGLLLCSIIFLGSSPTIADVEWESQGTIAIDKTPVDIAVSLNDKWVFVLNNKSEILIYSKDGELADTLQVGKHITQIDIGPRENQLFLTSRKKKTVETIELDFIQDINTAGSPFKGAANAAVVIAVFSDFQ